MHLRRAARALALGSLVLASTVILPSRPATQAAPIQACPAPLGLSVNPQTVRALAPGTLLRIWDARFPGRKGTFPVAIVDFIAGSTRAIPEMGRPPRPFTPDRPFVAPPVIATLNGDYFDYVSASAVVPKGMVVARGDVLYAPRGWSKVVAFDAAGAPRSTAIRVAGALVTGDDSWQVAAVNDPRRGIGHSVFTDIWSGASVRLHGDQVLLFVKDRKIASISRDDSPRIARGGLALRVSARSARSVAVGDPARMSITVTSRDRRPVYSAAGHGGRVLRDGKVRALCSDYENLQRPRSMIAWDSFGRTWLLSAGTGRIQGGVRASGSTKRQLAQVARSLGADNAVALDGGGSTAMYARVGGEVTRVDAGRRVALRPIPQVWTVVRQPGG